MAPFALEGLGYFREAGNRSPDFLMVQPDLFTLLDQDPRPASQLLDTVLVESRKFATAADHLPEAHAHFDFSETILIEKLPWPDLLP